MKKVLVTGGAGYIGSACSEYLLDRGYEVTIFDALITGHREAVDPRAKFILGNLADRELIKKVCREGEFDAVMHFAAFSLVGESMQNPSKYFRNNLASGINLADAAVEGGVKNFVFSSTAATFGQPESIPIRENDRQIPINPYGESKLCFEKVLKWYSEIHGMKYAALRYFNAAGASEKYGEDHRPESHLIPIILQTIRGKREKLMVYGDDYDTPDGSAIRDYIDVVDLAKAHVVAVGRMIGGKGKNRYEYFNIGTGRGRSVLELVSLFERATGVRVPHKIVGRRTGDIEKIWADTSYANRELGWKAERSIEDTLRSAWAWEKRLRGIE